MNTPEAIIAALIIEAKAVEADVISMQAHDAAAEKNGTGMYTEEAYLQKSAALFAIATQIQEIARSGMLP